MESFLLRKQGATWDNLPLPAFTIRDVDDNVIKRFKKWAAKKSRIEENALDEPKEVLMKKLHLMNNGYLTNASMLLFANDPETWQPGAFTKIGFFESDSELLYQDEIHGSPVFLPEAYGASRRPPPASACHPDRTLRYPRFLPKQHRYSPRSVPLPSI